MGYADDITQATNSPADAANEILRNAKRGAALTRQLLAFSRESAYTPRVINLSDTVKNVSGMLKRLIGEQTLVQLDLALIRHPFSIANHKLLLALGAR